MTKSTKTKPLSARQLRFCQEYISADSAVGASITAGYAPKGAAVAASRLLKNDYVLAEITRRQDEASERAEIREDDVIKMLLEDREAARKAKQFGPSVRATELLGRKLGMFIDKRLVGEITEHTDEQIAASLAKATARGDSVLARTLFHNALANIGSDTFDPRSVLSDGEIDALIEKAP